MVRAISRASSQHNACALLSVEGRPIPVRTRPGAGTSRKLSCCMAAPPLPVAAEYSAAVNRSKASTIVRACSRSA